MLRLVLVVLLLVGGLLPQEGPATSIEVILTADQVVGANDIEHAIEVATQSGSRPGVVILDGRAGPFVYDHPDRSINILYSNVILRGVNGARFLNCGDGVFFDDYPLHDVTIQGIEFFCDGDGVTIPWGTYEVSNVRIEDNVLSAPRHGVYVLRGRQIRLQGNRVKGATAVALIDTQDAKLVDNQLRGFVGVILSRSDGNQVTNSRITASERGVVLMDHADDNKITGNRIEGPYHAGIALLGDNQGNKIHGNAVACADGVACQTVYLDDPGLQKSNKISGNKP